MVFAMFASHTTPRKICSVVKSLFYEIKEERAKPRPRHRVIVEVTLCFTQRKKRLRFGSLYRLSGSLLS